jgi:hypothetical protein
LVYFSQFGNTLYCTKKSLATLLFIWNMYFLLQEKFDNKIVRSASSRASCSSSPTCTWRSPAGAPLKTPSTWGLKIYKNYSLLDVHIHVYYV